VALHARRSNRCAESGSDGPGTPSTAVRQVPLALPVHSPLVPDEQPELVRPLERVVAHLIEPLEDERGEMRVLREPAFEEQSVPLEEVNERADPVSLAEDPDPEATVDAGERGEIIARGPGMSDGYIDNPDADEKTYFDGWLRTRDVARVDEEGYLYIVDRVDNMIVSGGENVYPAEVERVLGNHPDVEEACVFGRDDDQWGEVVTAVVVVAEGADVSDEDLDQYCLQHDGLADFKRPREYAITHDALPRTDTGTIMREQLVEKHFS